MILPLFLVGQDHTIPAVVRGRCSQDNVFGAWTASTRTAAQARPKRGIACILDVITATGTIVMLVLWGKGGQWF